MFLPHLSLSYLLWIIFFLSSSNLPNLHRHHISLHWFIFIVTTAIAPARHHQSSSSSPPKLLVVHWRRRWMKQRTRGPVTCSVSGDMLISLYICSESENFVFLVKEGERRQRSLMEVVRWCWCGSIRDKRRYVVVVMEEEARRSILNTGGYWYVIDCRLCKSGLVIVYWYPVCPG